ncbi:hypothetical protein LCGC14_2270410 [marine sediment metagenome]|uniref:Uncharacterized protein n=1 Tax=marine sediment metagenome TaxID=412755 RepID=A0A0F9F9K1_9ZZZZ
MVKYFECSKCGNKAVDMPIKEPNVVCWNCMDNVSLEDFDKVDLENLFFEASSIQKMGERFLLEIPQSLKNNIELMSKKLRTGRWIVQIKSKFGG